MRDSLATVAAIYEAFGRGDVPFILAQLAEDVRWEAWADNTAQRAGVPWLLPRMGRTGVAEFFRVVGAFRITDFRVLGLMAGGNQVVAEVVIAAEVPASGGSYRDEELHLWTFNEAGQVVRFRHYTDTAKHIAAAQGERAELVAAPDTGRT
jgi:ketosteroid isomerase-like protein